MNKGSRAEHVEDMKTELWVLELGSHLPGSRLNHVFCHSVVETADHWQRVQGGLSDSYKLHFFSFVVSFSEW